jgi:hypothetical protein
MTFHRHLARNYPWVVAPLLVLTLVFWLRGPKAMTFFVGAMLFYASVIKLLALIRHDGDGDAR